MSTQRTNIRNAIITVLSNAAIVAPGLVFSNRFRELGPEELPAVLVYTRAEKVSVWAESPREYERRLSVVIEIIAAGNDDLDDSIDLLCQKIEKEMCRDHTLGEKCRDVVLQSVDLSVSNEGDQAIGGARLEYEVTHYSKAVAIDDEAAAALPSLAKIGVKYDTADTVATIEAENVITVPTT